MEPSQGLSPFIAMPRHIWNNIQKVFNAPSPDVILVILLQGCQGVNLLLPLLHGQSGTEGAQGPWSAGETSVLWVETGLAAGMEVEIHNITSLAGGTKADTAGRTPTDGCHNDVFCS